MTCTGLDSHAAVLPGRARGYSRTERGEVVNAAYRDPSYGWGYGAVYSTAWDLWRFDRALRDGRLLSPGLLARMWSPLSRTPWGSEYGLGWFVGDLDGRRYVAAVGSTGGFAGILRDYGETGTVVVALLNHDFLLYEILVDQLSRATLGTPWTPVLAPAGPNVLDELSKNAGVYRMDDDTLLELRRAGEKHRFGPAGDRQFDVVSLGPERAYVPALNARLSFRPGNDGEVSLVAVYGNLAWSGARVEGRER